MSIVSQSHRKTMETDIEVRLSWGKKPGVLTGKSGIGFFDHMLTVFCHYGWLDMTLKLQGDWHIDQHHSLEDLGYVLGTCLRKLLDNKPNVKRQRFSHHYVPMDESLARAVVDLSGRPYLHLLTPPLKTLIGTWESDTLREFLRAFTDSVRITLHMEILYGINSHHMVEALFKAFGLALKDATRPLNVSGVNSTKGEVYLNAQEVL